MLNSIIRFSLHNRLLVVVAALFVTGLGTWQALNLPVDVFPNLNRPRVVVFTEAHGMAPEEVETLITIPLERVMNGASGVQQVRSTSGVGLSVVYVEFDWGTDIYNNRQVVAERVALASDSLPTDVNPQLMPISSIMGQIMIVGMTASDSTSPMQLRTLADWVVRQRLLTIPGVSQVIVMGGDRKQYQVLVDPEQLFRFGVTMHDVKVALEASNQNTAGGYLDQQGPQELLVRSLGRVKTVDEIRDIVVKHRDGQSITLAQLARVVEGAQVKRGESAAYVRDDTGAMTGGTSVLLTVMRQPDADTRAVSDMVAEALEDLQPSLPTDVEVLPGLYRQKDFIDLAFENVVEALRDGALLVVVILFLFLMNLRTTLITLTAIPLSIVLTALVFAAFGLSVNTMTLGGIAVAIGELVDDAIVDVENIFRRLRENRRAKSPRNPLLVVFQASVEVRNSIVFGTMIVILVFVPLFALSGMEGRLFTPLGISYIVSIASSLLVSLTVTPVLSYWLLRGSSLMGEQRDSLLLGALKRLAASVIRFSLAVPRLILFVAAISVGVATFGLLRLENDFLPPFNEGAVQINVLLPPGASLATTSDISRRVVQRLSQIDDLVTIVRKTGRAELDEHAEGVNVSELIATVSPDSEQSREDLIEEISEALADIPGIVSSVEQPLAHLISHMLSGVKAQVAIKLFGDDLDELRRQANTIEHAIEDVEGVRGLQVEQQTLIPQLRIEADGEKLKTFGLRRADVNEFIETAMQGQVISQVVDGQRTFDLLLRLDERFREDLAELKRLHIDTGHGGHVKLEDVAKIYQAAGPNTINREQVSKRIVVQCNVSGRGLVDVVEEMKERLKPIRAELPDGYFLKFSGQFESQQSASRVISVLFLASLVGMFMVLYSMFKSANLALQVMVALPMAFIGSVASLYLTGQTLTIASMVGFISLCGIASRNGILLINHYLHLVEFEGESWTIDMVVRAGKDRLAPVLMTALTSGIGLVPLALAAGEPGKEILYPVATVIIGGLVTSTLLEFLVRPALFWTTGVGAARSVVQASQLQVELIDEGESRR